MSLRDAAARRLADEAGVTIVEALASATLLVVGILSIFVVLDSSRELVSVSERKEAAVHEAELQLERVKAQSWGTVATATAPAAAAAGDDADVRRHVSGGRLDWDLDGSGTATEPLTIAAVSAIQTRATWGDGRVGGTVDVFVTDVQAGTVTDTGLRRVTVAVRLSGDQGPKRPIVLSSLVSQRAPGAS